MICFYVHVCMVRRTYDRHPRAVLYRTILDLQKLNVVQKSHEETFLRMRIQGVFAESAETQSPMLNQHEPEDMAIKKAREVRKGR